MEELAWEKPPIELYRLKFKGKNKVMFISAEDLCINLLNQLNQMKWLSLKSILEILIFY